jgi:hypothetical protein
MCLDDLRKINILEQDYAFDLSFELSNLRINLDFQLFSKLISNQNIVLVDGLWPTHHVNIFKDNRQ